ncbi:MAG: TadE/TadG family type IV pilus assembly protein [Leucobacter sp.]
MGRSARGQPALGPLAPGRPRPPRRLLGIASPLAGVLRDERGTVTAEFAIVLPAVLAVLGLVIGALLLASHRVALVSVAADVARLEARGDEDAAKARLGEARGVRAERERRGALHCVTLRSSPAGGALAAISVSARACAATSDAGSAQ